MAWYAGCDYVACSHCRGARRGGAGLRFVANAYSSASGDELEVYQPAAEDPETMQEMRGDRAVGRTKGWVSIQIPGLSNRFWEASRQSAHHRSERPVPAQLISRTALIANGLDISQPGKLAHYASHHGFLRGPDNLLFGPVSLNVQQKSQPKVGDERRLQALIGSDSVIKKKTIIHNELCFVAKRGPTAILEKMQRTELCQGPIAPEVVVQLIVNSRSSHSQAQSERARNLGHSGIKLRVVGAAEWVDKEE
ncbi:hypothetical protein C8R45DRAFT_935534 [Mycena sanguinolenta]|nr:hypothetical protein C8R45DRAFT_935534 [Mycena sanguinolenta]